MFSTGSRSILIFWGGGWSGSPVVGNVVNLFAGLHGSYWQGIMGQYQVYGDPSLGGYEVDTTPPPSNVSENDVDLEAAVWQSNNGWSTGLGTAYIIFNKIGTGMADSWIGAGNCGVHAYYGGLILGNVADYGATGPCTSNGEAGATTLVASHEFSEMATDPYPTTGWAGTPVPTETRLVTTATL